MEEIINMKIKGFDKNLQCRGFQFEIGKEYKIELNGRKLELCTDTCFHYCNSLQQVHRFYKVTDDNRFCEIEVLGEEISDGEKCGSNHIKIVREIVGDELNRLKSLVYGNTSVFNTGSFNSGKYNSGNHNSGNYNSGYYNSGYYNSGNCNSGYRNSGCYNAGDYNSGYYNSGYYNAGHYNSGLFNACNNSNGVFCTEEPKINIFNMPTNMTMREFRNSKYYRAIFSSPFNLTKWIECTAEEKAQDENKALIGGYLQTYSYKEACQNWWENMSTENKEIIKSMPNFNAEIFKEITGIETKENE
jgi:hypothetical protein